MGNLDEIKKLMEELIKSEKKEKWRAKKWRKF
ncbi:hypothetical protein EV203_11727 [Caldanaerobacter subterraneus]|uniref:Uncharacterized protein n=1 Tax=Caldanaerobacter subterraneus TaxID=911092 RepID=A0A4R2JSE4_9THEO|nr:hypothetical protein EV203_11727 [Caldanaerobacter subterraneus]